MGNGTCTKKIKHNRLGDHREWIGKKRLKPTVKLFQKKKGRLEFRAAVLQPCIQHPTTQTPEVWNYSTQHYASQAHFVNY